MTPRQRDALALLARYHRAGLPHPCRTVLAGEMGTTRQYCSALLNSLAMRGYVARLGGRGVQMRVTAAGLDALGKQEPNRKGNRKCR